MVLVVVVVAMVGEGVGEGVAALISETSVFVTFRLRLPAPFGSMSLSPVLPTGGVS